MRIYLASRYSRRLELCGYREQLKAMGYHITSRWLNGEHQISDQGVPIGDHGEKLIEGDDGSKTGEAARLREQFALEDFQDVMLAHTVISFTEEPRSGHSRGGRHVEFGMAIAADKRVIVIGHRENIFHWLPEVEFYPTWQACLEQSDLRPLNMKTV